MSTIDTTLDTQLIDAARALRPAIRAQADEIEAERRLPATLVGQLVRAGFFRMWVPRELGGDEVDPCTAIRVVEELSQADGSTGWCVMIQAQSARFVARLAPEGATQVCAGPDTAIAGTIQLKGRAIAVEGGYRVTGRWPYLSGSSHAQWFLGLSAIADGDAPRTLPNGAPDVRPMFFPAGACDVIDVWHTTGLRGTASNDIAVTDLFVPAAFAGLPAGAPPTYPGPLQAIAVFLFSVQGAQAIGVAAHAIEAVVDLALEKTPFRATARLADQPRVQAEVAHAQALVGSARSYLLDATAGLWQTLLRGETPAPEQRTRVALAGAHAITSSVKAAERMYRVGGSTSIHADSPLDRCLRDIHTAAAHHAATPAIFEAAGRPYLGLDPAVAWL